jgi:hypothetical protein
MPDCVRYLYTYFGHAGSNPPTDLRGKCQSFAKSRTVGGHAAVSSQFRKSSLTPNRRGFEPLRRVVDEPESKVVQTAWAIFRTTEDPAAAQHPELNSKNRPNNSVHFRKKHSAKVGWRTQQQRGTATGHVGRRRVPIHDSGEGLRFSGRRPRSFPIIVPRCPASWKRREGPEATSPTGSVFGPGGWDGSLRVSLPSQAAP